MSPYEALLLGLVQGATEFLPVSSSGHLVILPRLLGWRDPGLAFDAFLHLGTLVAVLAYFWADLVGLAAAWVRSLRGRSLADPQSKVAWLILLATVPGAFIGLGFEGLFERLFSAPLWASSFLLVTGLLLVMGERVRRGEVKMEGLSWVDALFIGLAQGLAIIPGLSRSGATISAGLWRGMARDTAARFSFLLATPIILGAGLLTLLDLVQERGVQGLGLPLIGLLAAAASGYLAIRFLLGFLQRHNLYPFAIYCWAAGGLTLIWALFQG